MNRGPFGRVCTLSVGLGTVLIGVAIGACAAPRRAALSPEPQHPETLRGRLRDFELQARAGTPPARLQVQELYTAELRQSGMLDRAVKVGTKAPLFALPGASGDTVRLADLLQRGPVVLLWYRGGWSPYCTLTLRAYQDALDEFRSLGAEVVAVSPQTLEMSQETSDVGGFEFHVLSDVGNQVARQYGLVHKLPETQLVDLVPGVDLTEYNGDSANELPVTATYLIARDGIVRFAFVDPDPRERAEPAEVIAAIKELGGPPPPP